MCSTSTLYIDLSTTSGSIPWLIVRLPCGSMSTASTRCPDSANATARLSVVVVLATPPFWLANAITLALPVPGPAAGRDPESEALFAFTVLLPSSSGSVARRLGSGSVACSVSGPATGCGGTGSAGGEPERYSGRANRWSNPIAIGYSQVHGRFLQSERDDPSTSLPGVPSILDKRLLFVTGKGGVGKSTVSAALGMVAARRGKRTIVCELSQQERMSSLYHRQGVGYHETEIADNLFAFSVDPQRALEEYLLLQIKIKPLYDLMFRNRIFTYFAAATPGMRELVTIGKVWELAQLDRKVKDGRRIRPGDRRRAGDRARPGRAANAQDLRRHRPRRPDQAPGRHDQRLHHRSVVDLRLRGRAARGDAGQRDARLQAEARRATSAWRSTG